MVIQVLRRLLKPSEGSVGCHGGNDEDGSVETVEKEMESTMVGRG